MTTYNLDNKPSRYDPTFISGMAESLAVAAKKSRRKKEKDRRRGGGESTLKLANLNLFYQRWLNRTPVKQK